jgi:hypothetical protein
MVSVGLLSIFEFQSISGRKLVLFSVSGRKLSFGRFSIEIRVWVSFWAKFESRLMFGKKIGCF